MAKIDIDSAQTQHQNSVLQGQEQMTLRNNLTESTDSDSTVQKPMMWSPSPNGKAHTNFQQRPMDNWMPLGRRETDFKDTRSAFKDARTAPQSFGDTQGFFMQSYDDNHHRLSFNNQFQDQGSAPRFADPYFYMPQQPPLTVESSTRTQTGNNDLRFWSDQNAIYGNPGDQQQQGFNFGQHPSSWLSQPFPQVEQPRVVRPHATVAPFDLEKTREGSGFKIFGFQVDTSASPIQLSSPLSAIREHVVQNQQSVPVNEMQPVQNECLPEGSVSTAGTATENEKSIQQAQQSSKDIQSKSQSASTRSCTKVSFPFYVCDHALVYTDVIQFVHVICAYIISHFLFSY